MRYQKLISNYICSLRRLTFCYADYYVRLKNTVVTKYIVRI